MCFYGVKQKIYKKYVIAYLQKPFLDNVADELYINKCEMLKALFSCDFFEFYDLIVFENSKDKCMKFAASLLENLVLSELASLVSALSMIVFILILI